MIEVTPWTGQRITAPGVYSGIPLSIYHQQLTAEPSASNSILKVVEESTVLHAREGCYLNPNYEPGTSSEAQVMGSAVHHLFTGEHEFAKHFWVKPETYPAADGSEKKWTRGAKYCAEKEDEATNAGKGILKPDAVPHIAGMAKSLAAHPAVKEGILNGLVEHSLVWKDPVTGLWLKSRPDTIPLDSDMVSDLKTTTDASHFNCMKSLTDHGYFMQLALVHEGMLQTTGRTVSDYFLVFVEKTPPYAVAVRLIDWTAIEFGRRLARRAINKLATAIERDEWPAYEDDDRPLTLMPWRAAQLAKEAEEKTLPGYYDPPHQLAEHAYREVAEAN